MTDINNDKSNNQDPESAPSNEPSVVDGKVGEAQTKDASQNSEDESRATEKELDSREVEQSNENGTIAKAARDSIFPTNGSGNEEVGESEKVESNSEGENNAKDNPKVKNSVSPIRTYESDTQETIKQQQATLAQIAVAQQDADRKSGVDRSKSDKDHPIRHATIIITTTLLILGAFAVVGYAFWYTDLREEEVPTETLELANFFRVENSLEISTDNQSPGEIQERLSAIREELQMPVGSVTHIYLTRESAEGAQFVDWLTFLNLTGTRGLPERLSRSVTAHIYGMVLPENGNSERQPFWVLRVNSYEGAFASLLQWEQAMSNSLVGLFGNTSVVQAPVRFEDRTVENRHVRVLPDASGNTQLIWSFVGRDIVVITTNLASWKEIVTRVEQSQLTN